MKLKTTIMLGCLVVLSSGCSTKPTDPTADQVTPHLVRLRDKPDQQQMFKAMGECERLREAHGPEAVASALKQIARQNPDLQEQALSLLSRYVSVEEHSDFVMELKMKK